MLPIIMYTYTVGNRYDVVFRYTLHGLYSYIYNYG